MNDSEQYLYQEVRYLVEAGFEDLSEIREILLERIADELDSSTEHHSDEHGETNEQSEVHINEAAILSAADSAYKQKLQHQKAWTVTDVDKLNAAFSRLEHQQILCAHDAGFTLSEGREVIAEIAEEESPHRYIGYCYYHRQDVQTALDGGGLYLAYGYGTGYDDSDDETGDDQSVTQSVTKQYWAAQTQRIALLIVEALTQAGLDVVWHGDLNYRLHIQNFIWQNKSLPE